jgi:hypothetical protein
VANAGLGCTICSLSPLLKPERLEVVYVLEQRFADQFQVEVELQDYLRSVAHGKLVADAILRWATTDGYATVSDCPYVTITPEFV